MGKWIMMNFGQLRAALAVAAQIVASSATADVKYTYGRHFPNGQAAVDHIYGEQGTFRRLSNVKYRWNYYDHCGPSKYPVRKQKLISDAAGNEQHTSRDANCRLLLDFDHNGEIDVTSGGQAFHEHNAIGVNGQTTGQPFTIFWFDDNWFARYMSDAYNREQPYGLGATTGPNRWQMIGGETREWKPSGRDEFDLLTLDGLYYLSAGDLNKAIARWDLWLSKSKAQYDDANQRFNYPEVHENYHLGLFRILTEHLLKHGTLSDDKRTELEQHSVHLRSLILSNQERSNGTLIGWRTSLKSPAHVINTETVTANVLGLGAGGRWAFEVDQSPMQFASNNYFVRPHNVISAVAGLSIPGHIAYPSYARFPTGNMTVEYHMRAPSPTGTIAVVDVRDVKSGETLGRRAVASSDVRRGNLWTKISLPVNVSNPSNVLEFRIYWTGATSLEIAHVQIR